MTEYLEDDEYEEDEFADHTAREQLAELQAQVQEQEELADVQAEIVRLQRLHGSRFTEDEVQAIGQLIDAGHDPQDAYEAVEPETPEQQDAEADFQTNVARLEREEGRALSSAEQDNVWKTVVDDGEEIEIHDTDTREGRQAWASELLAETFPRQEAPEVVEPLHDDATAAERSAYISARLAGASEAGEDYE